MTAEFRLKTGGEIDRAHPISFSFDGNAIQAFRGDSVASALLANGVGVVGRSFKYHRPRGVYSAGAEEPNALVTVGQGPWRTPNTKATMIEARDGLVVESQNCWPSPRFDLGAINDRFSAFIPAGFYYKTFMGPPLNWMFFEHLIRNAAGMGRAGYAPDPDHYEKQTAHCDVLVVGAGPAGIAAASAAASAGARVILLENDIRLGGALVHAARREDERAMNEWSVERLAFLKRSENVRILTRTAATGCYDHMLVAAVESAPCSVSAREGGVRERLWLIRAKRVVLATGATERPMVFANNDRPGVMLASAVGVYIRRYAVAPGKRPVVFTNNDSAYAAALDLFEAGIAPVVVDVRETPSGPLYRAARRAELKILTGAYVKKAHGELAVHSVEVARVTDDVASLRLECDLLAVSGGWSPNVHLHSQAGGATRFDENNFCFLPGASAPGYRSSGAANGVWGAAAAISDGWKAGQEFARECGFDERSPLDAPQALERESVLRQGTPVAPCTHANGKRFVDLQSDVTVSDIELAAREGLKSVEHVKRYTTLGMGTDQGKTSNLTGALALAEAIGRKSVEVAHTKYRPPYIPVSIGVFAHRHTGRHYQPIRRTAMHEWHEAAGAVWGEAGLWLRPRAYPRSGETFEQAIRREARTVRDIGGIVDVSTLGKIELIGADAAEFLHRVYVNSWKTLAVGKVRYGLMLREDGIAYDDGTTARLSDNHFVMTTTTANAAKVLQNLEYYAQVVWPDLDVSLCSTTEQWAVMAIAGPRARDILKQLVVDRDVSNEALPFMGCAEASICGARGRVFRISFSGELAYEVAVPANEGKRVWEVAIEACRKWGAAPYGTEAMGVLRIEKGHPAGPELDGRSTAADLGLAGIQKKKAPFIGSRLLERPGLRDPSRPQMMGVVPLDPGEPIIAGALIVSDVDAGPDGTDGHVSSACFSPNLNTSIGLAFVKDGAAREGSSLFAISPLHNSAVRVNLVKPVFIDPEGARLHG